MTQIYLETNKTAPKNFNNDFFSYLNKNIYLISHINEHASRTKLNFKCFLYVPENGSAYYFIELYFNISILI